MQWWKNNTLRNSRHAVNLAHIRLVDFTEPGKTRGSGFKGESHGLTPLGSVNLHVSMENLSNPTENQIWLEMKIFKRSQSALMWLSAGKYFPFLINIVLIAHFYSSCPCIFLSRSEYFHRTKSVFISIEARGFLVPTLIIRSQIFKAGYWWPTFFSVVACQ